MGYFKLRKAVEKQAKLRLVCTGKKGAGPGGAGLESWNPVGECLNWRNLVRGNAKEGIKLAFTHIPILAPYPVG